MNPENPTASTVNTPVLKPPVLAAADIVNVVVPVPEDGVKDNYMVKAFKYKLVPKDKNGNYVQKGSGLEVKNF